MPPNKPRDGTLADTNIHENRGTHFQGNEFRTDGYEDEESMLKLAVGRLSGGEHVDTTNTRNPDSQPKTFAQAHPHLISKPTIVKRLDPDLARRLAAADNDLKRRLAIEAAMANLGHSYDEAVLLVARIKELGMDLGAFIKNTSKAKERSSCAGGRRVGVGRRSMLDVEFGALGLDHGRTGDQVEDEVDGALGDEGQGGTECEEWRFWCE